MTYFPFIPRRRVPKSKAIQAVMSEPELEEDHYEDKLIEEDDDDETNPLELVRADGLVINGKDED